MSISTRGAERITPKAFFTGREIGASTARAVTLRMMRLGLLIFVSSLDTVPSHQSRRRPVGCHRLQQPAPGVLGGEGYALGLAGVDRQRIQPERLPAVVEPVQHPEMMTMEEEDFRCLGAIGQGNDHRPALLRAQSRHT